MSKPEPEPFYITPEEIDRETGGAISVELQRKKRMRGWLRYVREGKKILYVRSEWRALMAAKMRAHTRDGGARGRGGPKRTGTKEAVA